MVVSCLILLLTFESCLGMSKHSVVHCLASSSWADKHQSVSHLASVVELNNLLDEGFIRLNFQMTAGLNNLNFQIAVVDNRLGNSGEEILNDVLKQWKVVL